MPGYSRRMSDNVVTLDLARFTAADAEKIEELQRKLRMMRRWCRFDRIERNGAEAIQLYSGDRGRQPYASYRLSRSKTGVYELFDGRSGDKLAIGRTVNEVIDALPEDFYHSRY